MGACFRRRYARTDRARGVTAVAHQLALQIYAMRTQGEERTGRGQDYFWERHRLRVVQSLTQRAKGMGMQRVPSETPV